MANAEGKVQRALIDALTSEFPDIYVRKVHQTMYSHSGIPDLIGCLAGLWFAVEVKTNTGKVTKLQERELKLIDKAGGIGLVCYGVKDIQYVISILRSAALQESDSDD